MFFNGLIEEDKLSYNLCEIEKIDCKIRNKTNLTLKELTIGKFMYNVYLSSLENYIYHICSIQILSNNLCGRL